MSPRMQAVAEEEGDSEGQLPRTAGHKGGGKIETLSSDAIAQLKKAIADELKKKPTDVTTPSLTQGKVNEMMAKFDQMMELAQAMPSLVRSQVDESFKDMRLEMEDVKVENDILRLSLGLCIKTEEDFHSLNNIMAMKYNKVNEQIEFIKKIKKNFRGAAKTAAADRLAELEKELQEELSV